MIGIALFLAGAALAYGIAKWLSLPPIPVLIVAGIALEQVGAFPREILQETLILGVTFLLFTTGIELSPHRVRQQRGAALRVGLLQFLVLGLLGVLTSLALGLAPLTALYLGLALTASSTLVVVRLLIRRKQLFEPFGRLVVGVLLVQDVLVILLIPLLTRTPQGWRAVLLGLLGTVGLVALAYVVLRWVAPRIVALQWEEEALLLSALAVLFLFVGLADLLGLPVAAGAFLAGVSLSPFPTSGIIRGQLFSVTDFFTAIFFLALGGLLTPPGTTALLQSLALALVVVVATPPLVTWVAERAGFSARPAVEAGLLLSQTSEISLVVGLHALILGQIDPEVFTILALVTVVTMVLTPVLTTEPVVELLLRLHPLPPTAAYVDRHPTGHVLLLGCGAGGMPLLETLVALGEEVVVIDDDPEIIGRLREGEIACIRGDASDPEVLRAAGADRAKLVSSTIRRPRDNARLLAAARHAPVLVRVFDDDDAEWVRCRGGVPVLYSASGAQAFLRWYDTTFRRASPPEDGAEAQA